VQDWRSKMVKTSEFKQDDAKVKEFLLERVKTHEAIWDTTNPNYMKANIVTNCWLKILQGGLPDVPKQITIKL
jgi:hypothetical protein